jgi:ABC-type antimicrobial peptide transport system permease subunit
LSSAFLQLGAGLAIGIPVTIFGGRVMAGQLFGVTSHDPLLLTITGAVLALAAFFAAIVPARRAAATEPVLALRIE